MDAALCKLTLVYPPAIEDLLVELLLAADPPMSGFTTWAADGHGLDFAASSASEKVRGRIKRCVMVLVLARTRLPWLLETLKAEIRVAGVAYWIEPVEHFERLSLVAEPPAPAAPAPQAPTAKALLDAD